MSKYIVGFVDKEKKMIDHLGRIEDDGLLWNASGGTVTLFNKYDDARNAIKRTKTYAKRNGMPWFNHWLPEIYRVA